MDMGFSCRKNAFLPGVHKIGAAISGPRIAGRKFYGHEDFSEFFANIIPDCEIQANFFADMLKNASKFLSKFSLIFILYFP